MQNGINSGQTCAMCAEIDGTEAKKEASVWMDCFARALPGALASFRSKSRHSEEATHFPAPKDLEDAGFCRALISNSCVGSAPRPVEDSFEARESRGDPFGWLRCRHGPPTLAFLALSEAPRPLLVLFGVPTEPRHVQGQERPARHGRRGLARGGRDAGAAGGRLGRPFGGGAGEGRREVPGGALFEGPRKAFLIISLWF